MASHLEHIATHVPSEGARTGLMRQIWTRAAQSLRSAVCGLQGHDPLLQVQGRRLFLRCTSCGHETPGWTTSARGPQLRFVGDRERHRLN